MTDQPLCVILDDFLEIEGWEHVWSALQFCDLHPVTRGAGAWKLDDGVPLGGEELVVAQDADPAGIEGDWAPVLAVLLDEQEAIATLVAPEWDRVSARPYVYPQGSALSWHVDDSALFAGAFVYYAHPHWNAHWGGELALAAAAADWPIMGHRFASEAFSDLLLEEGHGQFVAPKPNRLVLLSGAAHQVLPVRRAAGDHVRASVSGFFLRPQEGSAGPVILAE